MSDLTHWKKLYNPDYLGAYSLEPGNDLIVTIASVRKEMIVGAEGKKEECMVMRFREKGVKPMVINATNAKAITKLLKTPYIEQWAGCRIQLYAAEVRAFGDTVEALRVRPFLPKLSDAEPIACAECSQIVDGYGKMTAAQMAEYTRRSYGKVLCAECATAAKTAREQADAATDVLGPAPTETGDATEEVNENDQD